MDILRPGLQMLEQLTHVPVLGVVPYLDVHIEEEDSLAGGLAAGAAPSLIDVAVIRLPGISNFTDFSALEQVEGVGLRYVRQARELGAPDLVILPGTKNTMGDLRRPKAGGPGHAGHRHLRRLPDVGPHPARPGWGGTGRPDAGHGPAAGGYGL